MAASDAVDLRWQVVHEGEAPRFRLSWSHQGGPSILTQPARRGSGSRLIERSFTGEVGGKVKPTYAATGLVCHSSPPSQPLVSFLTPHARDRAAGPPIFR